VGCAAALAAIAEIEEKGLVERSLRLGAWLVVEMKRLKDRYVRLGDVRGRSLMVGLEFVKGRETKEPDPTLARRVADEALARGAPDQQRRRDVRQRAIKMSPPLVITEAELAATVAIIDRSIARRCPGASRRICDLVLPRKRSLTSVASEPTSSEAR
jgi:4-aminobutyrate aminotransferase-like enzyme